MRIRERVAPLVALLTNKTVIISIVAAIAMVVGAMSVGTLIRRRQPFKTPSTQMSSPDPTHGPRVGAPSASTGRVAGSETEASVGSAKTSSSKSVTAPATPATPATPGTGPGDATPANPISSPALPPQITLPTPPNPITEPGNAVVPQHFILPPVQRLSDPLNSLRSSPELQLDLHLGL